LQSVEPVVPLMGDHREELLSSLDWCRAEPIADSSAFARLGHDQAGAAQEDEVLRDRLACHRQGSGEVADRRGTVAGESGEDGAAGRIGQSDKDLFGNAFEVRRH